MLAFLVSLAVCGQSLDFAAFFPAVVVGPVPVQAVPRQAAPLLAEPPAVLRCFQVSVVPGETSTWSSGGAGTESDPYLIRTPPGSEVAGLVATYGPLFRVPLRQDTRVGRWALAIESFRQAAPPAVSGSPVAPAILPSQPVTWSQPAVAWVQAQAPTQTMIWTQAPVSATRWWSAPASVSSGACPGGVCPPARRR